MIRPNAAASVFHFLLLPFFLFLFHIPMALGQAEAKEQEQLSYYSDYVSFVGRDGQGLAAFALDTNRGRDGDEYQAEHFTVFHVQNQGWIALKGNGDYPNPGRFLKDIPDSPDFRFRGSPQKGMTVVSVSNNLILDTAPLALRLSSRGGKREMRMASGPAVLHWQGRRFVGRVIYEYVHYTDWNRLTRTYWGTWDNFQGLYLAGWPEGQEEFQRDIYLRSTGQGKSQHVSGFLAGFLGSGSEDDSAMEWRMTVQDKSWGKGFYRWPVAWSVEGTPEGVESEADNSHVVGELEESEGNTIATWIIGGFRMGVVTGEMTIDGKAYLVYGFSEIIQ